MSHRKLGLSVWMARSSNVPVYSEREMLADNHGREGKPLEVCIYKSQGKVARILDSVGGL